MFDGFEDDQRGRIRIDASADAHASVAYQLPRLAARSKAQLRESSVEADTGRHLMKA